MNSVQATEIVTSVLGRIAPEADLDDVDPAADLRSEIDLDSLDFLAMIEGLKEQTGVDVPEVDYSRVRSLNGVIAYLVDKAGSDSTDAK